jgi:FlaA1/EpsC-like NDP-sugar epimerase
MISVVFDVVTIVVCLHLAFWLRLDQWVTINSVQGGIAFGLAVVSTLIVFIKLGLYRAVLTYLGFQVLATVAIGAVASAVFMSVCGALFDLDIPRSVPIIYGVLLAMSSGGSRLLFRGLIATSQVRHVDNVLIYGAGSAGRQLVQALRSSRQYHVVGFIDNDKTLCGSTLMGTKVHSSDLVSELVKKRSVKHILLAMPSASHKYRKQVLDALAPLPVEVRSVPELSDIVAGNAKIDDIKEVAIDDLLGRDPVRPQQALMEANIKQKVVMVTGAGGSIGSELCRQIIRNKPTALILFEISEFGLYQIHQELTQLIQEKSLDVELYPLLGSVQRQHRLETAMNEFGVQTVYHAAAYKHVPLVENNVVEGVRNNVFGTYYTAKAAIAANVESFVLISTDKAVRPTNVMGTTKRLAELGLQALAQLTDDHKASHTTRFCMVRFGNVLGSSGSVVPVFKKQIAARNPITVTHKDITRYFMTIPEAAQLVIQAGAMGRGGDVFVLDMGEPVKIVDLATNLINLSGLSVKDSSNPDGDIEIKFTGLRPGEKLYEELLIGDNNVEATAHERIMTAHEDYLTLEAYEQLLNGLDEACHCRDHERIRQIMLDAPAGFAPVDGIEDLVWKQTQKQLALEALFEETETEPADDSVVSLNL